MTTIFHSSDILGVSQSVRPRNGSPATPRSQPVYDDFLIVSRMGALTIFDAQSHRETTYELPDQFGRNGFQFYMPADGKAVATVFANKPMKQGYSQDVAIFSANGHLSRLATDVTQPIRATEFTPLYSVVFSCIVPEPLFPALFLVFPPSWQRDEIVNYGEAVKYTLAEMWLVDAITICFGIISVGLYWRRPAICRDAAGRVDGVCLPVRTGRARRLLAPPPLAGSDRLSDLRRRRSARSRAVLRLRRGISTGLAERARSLRVIATRSRCRRLLDSLCRRSETARKVHFPHDRRHGERRDE